MSTVAGAGTDTSAVGVVISCLGHLHSNIWRAYLFELRPLIINSFFPLHFKAALMLFEVRSLLEVLGYSLLSIDIKTKVVQNVKSIKFCKFAGSQLLSDVQTFFYESLENGTLLADMRKTGSTGSTACVIFLEAV